MTQPNKYIHEELWWVAYKIPELENVYRVYTDDMWDYNNFTDEQIDSKILDIEEHMVIALWFQPVEEEPKQELIPLDMEKIIDEIIPCFDWQAVRYYQLREVLSKYGTTPQKKRTEQEIRNMYYYTSSQNNDYNINDTLAPWIIITFLRKVWLLQE